MMPGRQVEEAEDAELGLLRVLPRSGESPADVQDPLVELGKKGWELITVVPYSTMDTGSLLIAFFKRPLEEKSEGFVIT
jgi:hypothetical protein